MTQYAVVSEFNEMSLRIDHDVNSTKIESIVMHNTVMLADSLWTAPADGTNRKAGDVWAHIVSVNQVAKNGWVAVKHLGDVYCTYSDTASPISVDAPTENTDKPLSNAQAGGLVTVRKWGDPHLFELDGMSTAVIKVGNFQEVPLFTPYKNNPKQGSFNAISSFQELGPAELAYLKKIQPDDSSKYGFNLKQKMGWLIGPPDLRPPGQIYWSEEVGWDDPALKRFRFGTLVFGGQKVLVETDETGQKKEYQFSGQYRAKEYQPKIKLELITFYKIIGMRKAEQGRPVSDLLREGKIQICTSANRSGKGEDRYTETLKGVVYNPVWSPLDYPSNIGNALYLAKEFCE
jgi:hypothetical protein